MRGIKVYHSSLIPILNRVIGEKLKSLETRMFASISISRRLGTVAPYETIGDKLKL